MATQPLVSIVTPTFNRVGSLREAIESVLAQTFSDWELIIVDDGSTDDTRQMVAQYQAQEPRIRYAYQLNSGASAARNRALGLAQGEFVAFLDDDDFWLPEKLTKQIDRFSQDPSLGFLYTKCDVLRNGARVAVWPYGIGRQHTLLDLFRG